MVRKLMRHEFRATQRIMLPLYLLLFVTAGLFNVSMDLMDNDRYAVQWPIQVLSGVSTTSFVVSIIGVTVLCGVLMIYRFYKNLMTDEGYLMFTLPVTTRQIIFSKLLVAMIWDVATLLVDILAAVLALCRVVYIEDLQEVWWEFCDLLSDLSAGDIIGYSIELALLIIASTAGSILLCYAAIALGHSFANHKILLSVVFYFAFSIGMQIVESILTAIVMGATMVSWEEFDPLVLGHWGLGLSALLTIVQAVVFYFLTKEMLRKRLNLQ